MNTELKPCIYESMVLVHHGVKGQKWGIRRFQNADGSYTDKGRKRYGIDKIEKRIEKRQKKIIRQLDKSMKAPNGSKARQKALSKAQASFKKNHEREDIKYNGMTKSGEKRYKKDVADQAYKDKMARSSNVSEVGVGNYAAHKIGQYMFNRNSRKTYHKNVAAGKNAGVEAAKLIAKEYGKTTLHVVASAGVGAATAAFIASGAGVPVAVAAASVGAEAGISAYSVGRIANRVKNVVTNR